MLKANGYPVGVIRRHMRSHRSSQSGESREPVMKVMIPYVRGLSESIRWILSPFGIQTTFQLNTTLQSLLMRAKDRVPDQDRAGVVYRIPCNACPVSYVGQTGRRLQQRVQEHKRFIKQGDTSMSALAEHI